MTVKVSGISLRAFPIEMRNGQPPVAAKTCRDSWTGPRTARALTAGGQTLCPAWLQIYHGVDDGASLVVFSHLPLVAGDYHIVVQCPVLDEAVPVPFVHLDKQAVFEQLGLQPVAVVRGEFLFFGNVNGDQCVELLFCGIGPEVSGSRQDHNRDDDQQGDSYCYRSGIFVLGPHDNTRLSSVLARMKQPIVLLGQIEVARVGEGITRVLHWVMSRSSVQVPAASPLSDEFGRQARTHFLYYLLHLYGLLR